MPIPAPSKPAKSQSAVSKLSNLFTAIALENEHNAKGGQNLTIKQLALLTMTYENSGPISLVDLATRLDYTKPGVTRSIDRLEQSGLVMRSVQPQDTRKICLELTKQGEQFAARLAHAYRATV